MARDFLPAAYKYPADIRAALPEIWAELLRDGALLTGVVEDPERPADDRICGVGVSVFVTDEFAEAALDNPVPYLNARLHRMILEGRSPVLDRRRIAEGNAGDGLSLLALHFCTRVFDGRDPGFMRMATAAQDLFLICHAGYRVKRMFKEVVGPDLAGYMRASGMELQSAYDNRPDITALPESEKPQLLLIDERHLPLGSLMSRMFFTAAPRFGFSPAEQRLLLCSLLHETDEEVAADLGLSLDTLRKQWRSIYQRVLFADPMFFGDTGGTGEERSGRGREKRRHLLARIRAHMEELRPYRAASSVRVQRPATQEPAGLQTA